MSLDESVRHNPTQPVQAYLLERAGHLLLVSGGTQTHDYFVQQPCWHTGTSPGDNKTQLAWENLFLGKLSNLDSLSIPPAIMLMHLIQLYLLEITP